MTQKPTVQLKKIIICIFKKEYQDSFGAFKVLGDVGEGEKGENSPYM